MAKDIRQKQLSFVTSLQTPYNFNFLTKPANNSTPENKTCRAEYDFAHKVIREKKNCIIHELPVSAAGS